MHRPRLLPDSLVGRTVLILLVGLLLSHALALFIYSGNRVDAVANVSGRHAADRVAAVLKLVDETPAPERPRLLRTLDMPGLRVAWGPQPLVDDEPAVGLAEVVRQALTRRLGAEEVRVGLGGPFAPPPRRGGRGERPGPPGFAPEAHEMMRSMMHSLHGPGQAVRIAVRLADGTWLNFLAPLDIAEPLWRPRFVGSLLVMALAVTLLSIFAARRAVRPFAGFAAASERLGIDVNAPPLAEEGPREVRRAAHAFNGMQARLRRFIDDRTQMLAAISHDLRTPITRLRLRAEFVEDDEQRERMLADLDEMEGMIAATLSFARDDATREERRPVDVAAMLQGLCDDVLAGGGEATYEGPEKLVAQARPTALKRAMANLVDNAVKYGRRTRVRLAVAEGQIRIAVEDDGPGIPEAERERVFAPFYRLEGSRNRETGGSGLGLAVVRNVARAHGGDATLANRPEGGLAAMFVFPAG